MSLRSVCGVVCFAIGGVLLFASLFSAYGIFKNAFFVCTGQPSPPGALKFEAGYADSNAVRFPVMGTQCSWNRPDGTVFSTFTPDVGATSLLWAGAALAIIGVVLLIARFGRANERSMSG